MAAYDNKLLNGEQLGTLVTQIKQADAAKQDKIDADHKLNPAYINTSDNNLFVTQNEKVAWNNKANASDIPDELADLAQDSTHRVVTDAEKVTWNAKADTSDIPTALSDLTADATHRLVSDTEKATWNGKADAADIPDELADLSDDATHRLVTDTEKANWDGKTTMTAVEAKGYQTAAQVATTVESYGYQNSTQVANAISTAIAGLTGFHFEIVASLPATGETNVIYLVLKTTTETGNIYTEYAWVITDSSTDPVTYGWERLGDTQVSIETLTAQEVTTIWNSVT